MEGRKSDRRKRKSRERRITWFNPPFSNSATTNVAHKSLKLVDTHFPKGTKLHAILNRNTVKVSYSCMPKIDTLIKRHNTCVCAEEQKTDEQEKTCNCRQPSECPLSGECLASDIVYVATVMLSISPPTTSARSTFFFFQFNLWMWSVTQSIWRLPAALLERQRQTEEV